MLSCRGVWLPCLSVWLSEDRYSAPAPTVPKWRAMPSAVRLMSSLSRYYVPVGDHDLTVKGCCGPWVDACSDSDSEADDIMQSRSRSRSRSNPEVLPIEPSPAARPRMLLTPAPEGTAAVCCFARDVASHVASG